MSKYGKGYLSSTTSSKCIICNKVTITYAEISNYDASGYRKQLSTITIPVCDEHYNDIPADILIGYVNHINKTIRSYARKIKEVTNENT